MSESITPLSIMLIVGDELDSELASFEFSAAGYTVSVPTDHQLAVEESLKVIPDVVFIDITLPDRAAYDIARRLGSSPDMASAWLVALGVDDNPGTHALASEARFLFKCGKKAQFSDLLRIVKAKEKLGRERAERKSD